MEKVITQRHAKVLIRDYLRETGRKGVTSLVRDIHRYTKKTIFTQRTFEKWLAKQDRNLQDDNWEVVLNFINSQQFRQYVPYANEDRVTERLVQVGDGLVALYSGVEYMQSNTPSIGHSLPNTYGYYSDVLLHPSQNEVQGKEVIKLLSGSWENRPDLEEMDAPRTICMIEPVPNRRYAKISYISLFGSKQISTTGLVIYINSRKRLGCDYSHCFLTQLWQRKDPETGAIAPAELYHWMMRTASNSENRQEFSISVCGKHDILRLSRHPLPEEEIMIFLLEDVLPHGYAKA